MTTLVAATLSEIKAELAALQTCRANMPEPQTEEEFDVMFSEYIGMGEVEGELLFAIANKGAEYSRDLQPLPVELTTMNYHTAIEQLRNELSANRHIHTLEQQQAGYLRLIELTQYLAAEKKTTR